MKRNLQVKIVLPAIGLLTGLSSFQQPQERGKADRKPNIIFILADDLGYHDIGALSSRNLITPNLDKMMSEGVSLTDFVVTCPACSPSRSGLLTGRYPQRNGMYDLIRNNEIQYGHRFGKMEYALSPEGTLGMDEREITVAELLKKAGYKTGMVGKWDSGLPRRFRPLQRGFDFFYGFCNTGIDYWTHERYGVPSMFRGNELVKEEGYSTELFKREAIRFIEQNKEQPFFLYTSFNAPHSASNLEHDSFQVPEEYVRMYGKPPGDKSIRYKAMITCMDAAIGEILAKINELGLDKNTLVIFTGDNGPGSSLGDAGPLRGRKAQMYEGGIREPFIAKWPGVIPAGKTCNGFCSGLDILPTMLGISGSKPPAGLVLDGYDILPLLKGENKSPRTEHFWKWRGKCAARIGKWKWVVETKSVWEEADNNIGELYDLSTDLAEQHNLASEKPEILEEVRGKWQHWDSEMEAADPRGPFRDY